MAPANAILWATENTNPAVLHAYDATDLSTELYNSNQAGTRDQFGAGNKFITPTIANGKVYVGTTNGVGAFGLLGLNATVLPSSLSFGGQMVGTTSSAQMVTLSNNGQSSLAITTIAASGDFSETNNCGGALAAGANCTITVTFKPTAGGTRTGTLSVTDSASGSPQTVGLSGSGEDFTLGVASGGSGSASVAAGQTAKYSLEYDGLGRVQSVGIIYLHRCTRGSKLFDFSFFRYAQRQFRHGTDGKRLLDGAVGDTEVAKAWS